VKWPPASPHRRWSRQCESCCTPLPGIWSSSSGVATIALPRCSRPVDDWNKLLGDSASVTALLDLSLATLRPSG
jgi:hypothetical protein